MRTVDNKNKYKQRKEHGKKLHEKSKIIICKCGCGKTLKELDNWGRKRNYISGHNGRKYDDPKECKRVWIKKALKDKKYSKKIANDKRLRNLKKKAVLVEEFGGSCSDCDMKYDGTNACCFDFHHLDPRLKKFSVNACTFNKFSKQSIYEEVKKCILVCSNCHRILHRKNPY